MIIPLQPYGNAYSQNRRVFALMVFKDVLVRQSENAGFNSAVFTGINLASDKVIIRETF